MWWVHGLHSQALLAAEQVIAQLSFLRASQSSSADVTTNTKDTNQLFVRARCLLADWQSRALSESSAVIKEQLMSAQRVADQLALQGPIPELSCRISYSFARFSDRALQSLLLKQSSPEYQSLQAMCKRDCDALSNPSQSIYARESKEYQLEQRDLRRLKKGLEMSQNEIQQFEQRLEAFLNAAVFHYCR